MRISHRPPDQRRHHRVIAPLYVTIHGHKYPALDWSLGGFGIGEYGSDGNRVGENLNEGEEDLCTVTIPFQGFDVSVEVRFRVVRRDIERQELAAKFIDLDERSRSVLEHFIDQIVRGYMTPVEDTIQRIDVPVSPVSTKPDTLPAASKAPLHRLPVKTIVMSVLYSVAGLMLFSYLSAAAYTALISLEVNSGVVSAPVEPIVGTVDGRIARIRVTPNQLIDADTPLLEFEDAKLEQEIDLAKIEAMRTTMAYEALQERLDVERSKTVEFGTFAEGEVERAAADVRSLQERLGTALAQVQRLDKLLKNGHTSRAHYDEALKEQIKLRGQLEQAESLLADRREARDLVTQGRFFNGERFEGELRELETALKTAEDDVVLAVRELDSYLDQRERLVVRAPSAGRVVSVIKSPGSSVKRGETIALFEKEDDRVIEVFLTQEELLEIRLGDIAEVYFPANGEKVQATIEAIDRTSGYLDEVQSKYDWRGPEDRTGRVTLVFHDIPPGEIRKRFPPGLPAVARFERASGRSMLAWIIDDSAMAAERDRR